MKKSCMIGGVAVVLTLAAIPALGQVQASGNVYFENPAYAITNDVNTGYSGNVGCNFQVYDVPGADTLTITALGFYAGTNGEWTGSGTVANSHTLSLWGPSATPGGNLSANNVTNVTLAAGTAVDANGFAWVTLNPPIALTSGDYYDLLTSVTSGSGNDAYLTPVDSSNNAVVTLPASYPFAIVEGAYSTSGYAYGNSTYLGPNMQYEVQGPTPLTPPTAAQQLYTPVGTPTRDNYGGAVGCEFETGPTNVIVSHLGYYSTNAASGLNISHQVALFNSNLSSPAIIGQVDVPSGVSADYYTNNYYWVHLDPPVLLSSNTTYVLAGLPQNLDGDVWVDLGTPNWNPAFVGNQATTTRHGVYAGNNGAWPPASFTQNGNNNTYGPPQLGYLAIGPARCGVQTTNSIAGTISVLGFASGQQPITNQWWKAGSPNTLISTSAGQFAMLSIPNATAANDGTYFMTSSNALGGEQSANVSVQVTAYPVSITSQSPTNMTVFQNYPADFFLMATGTPPISYQWSANNSPISGATGTNYSLTAEPANNGEDFSCLASNFVSGSPYTAQGSNDILTVIPNLAPPQEFLHGDVTGLGNNPYQGQQGGLVTIGSQPVLVTALGYYAWPASRVTNGNSVTITYSTDHHVGIYSTNGVGDAAGTYVPVANLVCSVDVPAGTLPVVKGYAWQPLSSAVLLSANQTYVLVAETKSDADWGDAYSVPDLNPYFATQCLAIYGGNAWGQPAYLGGEYLGDMYSAPDMAILTNTTPVADILPTNVVVFAGSNAILTAYVAGPPPMTLQWYTNGVALASQTNMTLVLSNLTVASSSSNYYVVATSPAGTVQSANGAVTVLSDGPTFVQNLQPLTQTAFNDQTVVFSASAEGLTTVGYQWYFEGSPISGATGSTLTLTDVSSNDVGNYYVVATNSYGSATSATGTLAAVEYPAPAGTYPALIMGPNLLLYYPLNDLSSGTATNWGAAGLAYDGSYVGGCLSVAGPPLNMPGGNDTAVSLDGSSGYVQLPPLTNSSGVASVTVSNVTIAAWVNDSYPAQNYPNSGGQYLNAAIFFQRASSVFGLSVNTNAALEDTLVTTWNGGFRNWSGMALPTNQWTLVAMTVNSTNLAVFMEDGNGIQSSNVAGAYPSATFSGNSEIGWDTAGGLDSTDPRLWTGPIANVMVFNQALSPTQINSLYTGVASTPITLTISPVTNNQLTVTWSGGTLLESTNVLGPWAAVPGAANGSYTTKPSNNVEFYRVQQ